MKGRKEIKTPVREDEKFHPLEYFIGSSPHVDKGRRGANMARQVERQSKQKTPE